MASPEAPPIVPVPKQVSRFEASLLRILRFFFERTPAEEVVSLIRTVLNRPPCFSADAVHLVRDTLSKGCVLYLVRAGGWKKERFLRAGQPRDGRLWERNPVDELQLEFSKHSLEFLIWLTANRASESKPVWSAPYAELTIADQLLLFLAYESLREEQDIVTALRSSLSFAQNGLCRLFHPSDFTATGGPDPSYEPWCSATGSVVIEALQPLLETRWLEIERSKGQLGDWEKMRERGDAEAVVLGRFLEAAERAKRWDLARFFLGVLSNVLASPDMNLAFWTGGLQGTGPPRLAERLETQRSALSLLRCADRFRQWEQRARTSGYLDDDYAASKFWLGEWERLNGAQTTVRAERIVQMLEPLRNPPAEAN